MDSAKKVETKRLNLFDMVTKSSQLIIVEMPIDHHLVQALARDHDIRSQPF